MNIASGMLIFLGFLLIEIGIVSKVVGTSLLLPFIKSYASYFIIANSCLLLALIIDRFQK